ncbi:MULTISPECIES: phosphoadenylyl-sulfate reductase [Cycloclasticus]|jgi:phosphoadenosine phosphosulfate reductase|uniref:Adenosine 5'-phosphosulfate reductase n=1 Tax=Cycloclasticus zancles 78-ME TaxID=1198232 RepID=S5T5L2_9GAMM|nr:MULTISPECIES: phosphoadenylyl-sulfate reductase [Cycloclasticus]AFT67720.1 5'-adenylylsulfate reductase [Cycloclasticus sp. P1]AGS39111.1 Phosphoadenylyl-sulfate reductase (thioredoxin) [Cycloclasticus zancles 78-ME]
MNIQTLQSQLDNKQPRDILKTIYTQLDDLAISFSGAEDVILIDMACKLGLKPNVFTLDTGRLHPETYQFIQTVMDHYKIKITVLSPNQDALQALTHEKGLYSFYQDGHKECCGIRKVQPLKQHLTAYSGWITGQRRDQSKATRDSLNIAEIDTAFSGKNTELLKFNPLCHWTSEQVWSYIRALEVPFNPLHNQGFISIGCEPCTRATLPHQDPREGRWWWEAAESKECGLHSSLSKPR